MLQSYDDKCWELQTMTRKWIDDVVQIWTRLFHHEMVNENLDKLTDHARTFYEELIQESLEKEDFFKRAIEDLQEEAENLCRLLKTNIDLPKMEGNNLPLVMVQSKLDESLTELRETLRQRRAQICDLLLEQESLCDELGEAPRSLLDDPLPSEDEINDFRKYLEVLKEARVARMKDLLTMRRDIKANLQKLGQRVHTDLEDRLLNDREIKLNQETLCLLREMQKRYHNQLEEMKDTIETIRKKVEALWGRLNTSPNTRRKFSRYTECNLDSYDAFYGELQRCEELKSQNIKMFVDKVREEIVEWWNKTLTSEMQRQRFTNFNNNCYTDDLLLLHEMELEELKHFYETNKQIFQLFDNRQILWERMDALEAKANDPARYNNRGGQLLKEEKERRTIRTKLPKIEEQIETLVNAYEERERKPFLIYGQNILELIANDWEKKRKEKEKVTSARKQGQASNSKCPLLLNSRTPMSMKNISTASSIRKAPSTTNLSTLRTVSAQKRKLNGADRNTPAAKRSLMYALNSPSTFLKPNAVGSTTKRAGTPFKPAKVLATVLQNRSGRRSANAKKRRSLNKSAARKENTPMPRIVVNGRPNEPSGESTDDTYVGFEKEIESASRSTIVQRSHSSTILSNSKRAPTPGLPSEGYRLAHLPNPTRLVRTPSKQNIRGSQAVSPGSFAMANNRKLTTKNLPIII